jgi:hypothetical protein
MRFISIPLLVAFLFASTHSSVDHGAFGHKSSVWLSHASSVPVQISPQHAQMHAEHAHGLVTLHSHLTDAHETGPHTHFILASFRRDGSTFLPFFLVLTSLTGVPDNVSTESAFFCDDPFGRPPRSRPLYLHCRSLLI